VRPDCSWANFEHELAGLAPTGGNACTRPFPANSVLATVVRPEVIGLRMRILRALQIDEPSVLVSDLDLRGYRRLEPGWIAARIACLVMALEITRLIANRRPVMRYVRTIIEASHWREAMVAPVRPRQGPVPRMARRSRQDSWQLPDEPTRKCRR
jgi:hypothetical protein